jgi:hypothetical protein
MGRTLPSASSELALSLPKGQALSVAFDFDFDPPFLHGSSIQQRPLALSRILVIPNGAEGPVRNLLRAHMENARVERTLLSAAFDFAFVLAFDLDSPQP